MQPVHAPGDSLRLLAGSEADDRDPPNGPLQAAVGVRPVGAVLDRALGHQWVRRLQEQRPAGGEQEPGLAHHHPGHRARAEQPGVRGWIAQRERTRRSRTAKQAESHAPSVAWGGGAPASALATILDVSDIDGIERVLVVVAHPDDCDFGNAGTTAKWTDAGVTVSYCIVTDGDAGGSDRSITREQMAGFGESSRPPPPPRSGSPTSRSSDTRTDGSPRASSCDETSRG